MKRVTGCLIVALMLLNPMKSFAQDIPLSLDDLIYGGQSYAKLHKYRSSQPQMMRWYGDKLTYVSGDSILEVPSKAGKKGKLLFTRDDINNALGGESIGSLNNVTRMYGEISSLMLRVGKGNMYLLNMATNRVDGSYTLTKDAENDDLSTQNLSMAYTKGANLYIQTKEGDEIAVTNETAEGVVNGQAVHQHEFGITKGTFWSPKGNYLAFYRKDESMVTDYPIVDMNARTAKLNAIKYPMAGMKSHQVTLGVYDVATERTVFLKTGLPKEKYLTNVVWSPDEKYIYIAELNRGQDTCVVNSYDALSGELHATLFTETHSKYVEPQVPMLFAKGDASQFVWQSRRDGYNHLYLYSVDSTLVQQITQGAWEVTEVLGWDEKGENLIYLSTEDSPIDKHIYKVNLQDMKRSKLSKDEGVHVAKLSESGKYLYDYYTSLDNPGKVALTEVKNGKSTIFHEGKNPYKDTTLPKITLGKLIADDGITDLHYRMLTPLHFDKNKKYPVIVYVYGGPHSQLVDNSWMGQARGWDIYMAEMGYVVFTLDNRGTAARGADFENITHRQLGVVETSDQMTGVNYLKSLPYVDANRIGVHGWSYGGFMTMNLMLRHPETFKVGVAGGPVTDWKYYEIMYGERYMDSPQDNPEGYKATSMVERAGDLQGRLLIIHGDIDPVVVPQHSMQFLRSAVDKGTHPDLFMYTGHEHNMMGKDRVHLHAHITRYFDDFLK